MGALGALGLTACGGTSNAGLGSSTPYRPGDTTVVGGNQGDAPTPTTAACQDATCKGRDQCGPNGAADVIVDDKGKVVDVLCYGQDVTIAQVPTAPVASFETNGNNAVLVIDGANDGVDVLGDVTISGNNAVVYGNGPETSVIGGTLLIGKNNAEIRGVRIKGDVTINKNNTKLAFCVIEGDLTITGNNTTLAGCDVFGKVTITGMNTVLIRDRVSATDAIKGSNLTCSANVRFDDANADHVIQAGEVGGPVSCGS
ncbi:MAG TPA: hypothetical protein VF395_13055 [Polyangiaceae bacterium]